MRLKFVHRILLRTGLSTNLVADFCFCLSWDTAIRGLTDLAIIQRKGRRSQERQKQKSATKLLDRPRGVLLLLIYLGVESVGGLLPD